MTTDKRWEERPVGGLANDGGFKGSVQHQV